MEAGYSADWLLAGKGEMLLADAQRKLPGNINRDPSITDAVDQCLLEIAQESGADVGPDEIEIHLPEDATERLLHRIAPFLTKGDYCAHPEEFATIPLYNVEACAGDGSYIEREEIATQLSFRRDWIHRDIHANPADLHLIYVRGDSMEPDLHDGEIVMVDTSFANRVPRDGIYVVQIDHQVAVKRLQRLPGDQVKVMSSNRAYEPFTAHLGDGELKVIGKVIWHAGPMG